MHIYTLEKWQHSHDFVVIHEKGEKRTKQVFVLTATAMIAEIVAGFAFGSMALLADGWHMGTHAAAFVITIFAYHYTKKHSQDKQFTFGTGKVSVLGGFASAVVLAVVALIMAIESIQRFFKPSVIQFNEAIVIAVFGLIINVICAVLLYGRHDHDNERDTSNQHRHDHNLKAAYLHVLADALTSILAIIALTFGKFFGWNWLDSFMGIVGAFLITRWSYGLLKDTSSILLDKNITLETTKDIIKTIESDSDNRVADIHVWRVGPADYAALITLVTHFPKDSAHYKKLLNKFNGLSHITIEVNQCFDEPCIMQAPDNA